MKINKKIIAGILIVLLFGNISLYSKGIPVIDITVVEKIYTITSNVVGWFKDRRELSGVLMGLNVEFLDKFMSVYEKVKYFEYKDIGLEDITNILETGPNFWDCFGENTWWEIWRGEKTIFDKYPILKKKIDLKDQELYKEDHIYKEYIDYITPVIKEMELEQENKLELQKKLKELFVDVFEKLEGFNERIDTSSRLTSGEDEEEEQVKVVRVLFNVVQIKIEQLAQKYQEMILIREDMKGFVKSFVRTKLIGNKVVKLRKYGEIK